MDSIEVSGIIPASIDKIREGFLDGEKHAAMTGAGATSADDQTFTAWDGYITGKTLQVDHAKITQTWRTRSFPVDSPDSKVEIRLEAVDDGTKVTFIHTEIPKGQGKDYEGGWVTHYLDPMKAYFGGGDAST